MDGAFAFRATVFRPLVWKGKGIEDKGIYCIKRFSEDGFCVDELDLKYISSSPVRKLRVRCGPKEILLRRMTLAITPAGNFVYVDRKTGSLYDAVTGKCKTSDFLRIEPGDL